MDFASIGNTLEDFLRLCPGICGEIARAIDITLPCSRPSISLAAAISFMGMVKCGRVKTQEGIEPNIYCVSIAPSGTGKTMAQNAIDELLVECGMMSNGMVASVSEAGLLRALRDEPRRLLIWDEFGIAIDELSRTSASHRALMLSTIMQLYSKAGNYYRGKDYAERERVDLPSPYLNIFAVSTGIRFFEALSEEFAHDGLLPRWLTFIEPEKKEVFQPRKPFVINPKWLSIIKVINEGVVSTNGNLGVCHKEKLVAKFDKFHEKAEKMFQIHYLKGTEFDRIFWRRGYENYCKIAFAISDSLENVTSSEFAYDLTQYIISQSIEQFRSQIGKKTALDKAREKFLSLVDDNWISHTKLMVRAQHIKAPAKIKNDWIVEATEDLEIWAVRWDGERKKSKSYKINNTKQSFH